MTPQYDDYSDYDEYADDERKRGREDREAKIAKTRREKEKRYAKRQSTKRRFPSDDFDQQEEGGSPEQRGEFLKPFSPRPFSPQPFAPKPFSPKPFSPHPFDGAPHEHCFGPHTKEYFGAKIDFDGVSGSPIPIESHYGGSLSYGLKFVFVAPPGKDFHKTIWYGADKSQRDRDYVDAVKYRQFLREGGPTNGTGR